MSFAASAAFIGPVLYVYYYSSASAPSGALFAITNNDAANATANSMVIQGQNLSTTSLIGSPTSAWMFSYPTNQLMILLNQSPPTPPVMISLQPQSTPVVPVAFIPWMQNGTNSVKWTITAAQPALIPAQISVFSMASGTAGVSGAEGSALYEVFSNYLIPTQATLNQFDIAGGKPVTSIVANNIDSSTTPKVVRLPASETLSVVVIGKCTSTPGTCMVFPISSGVISAPQPNLVYSPASCYIASSTNKLIVMVSTSGISTFDYGASALSITRWTSVSKTGVTPLSCSVNGTQLFVVVQGTSQPVIVTATMSGAAWAWQTPILITPVTESPPPPPPKGSSGDSGGAPRSGGNGNGGNSYVGYNGSQSGSTTGFGKPVIIAIAVVAAVILILIPALFIWCRHKRQNGKQRDQRTEELKKSLVLEHGDGKRMGMSMPLPRDADDARERRIRGPQLVPINSAIHEKSMVS